MALCGSYRADGVQPSLAGVVLRHEVYFLGEAGGR